MGKYSCQRAHFKVLYGQWAQLFLKLFNHKILHQLPEGKILCSKYRIGQISYFELALVQSAHILGLMH